MGQAMIAGANSWMGIGMRMEWMSGWLGRAGSDAGGREKAFRQAWRQLEAEVDGQRLGASQLQVVMRHAPAGSGTVRWYCRGPGRQWYLASGRCRRQWHRWQVRWQLQRLDEDSLYQALCADQQVLQRVYGHRVGDRLYA